MNAFEAKLSRRLLEIQQQGLYREMRPVDGPQGPSLTVKGRPLINFASNDYLGLANHPAVKAAALTAVERFGVGSGASRLLCGSLAPHRALEATLARFKQTEAALAFSSGYATALGTIGALVDKDDVLILDKLAHACLIDAARHSGASLRVFFHNDLNDLERKLKWARQKCDSSPSGKSPAIWIVTESVFSMDGDVAPLRELVDLKERYGAWLFLDEAHATGLYGADRRGCAAAAGVAGHIEVQMGTLGKAAGAAGGFVCGGRTLIDYLINRARTFIFSTASPLPMVAAALAGIEILRSDEGEQLRKRLWMNVRRIHEGLVALGWDLPPAPSAIIPLRIGDEGEAMQKAQALWDQGIYLPAIRFPTVARGQARLRLTVSAAHSDCQIDQLLDALRNIDVCRGH